jgi:anti-sigma B factor antagonist
MEAENRRARPTRVEPPRVQEFGDVTVLSFFDDITIGRGDEMLRDCVAQLLGNDRIRIVLDLQGVRRMDSAGVGELVACYKRTTAAGGALKLLNLPAAIEDLLHVAKLNFLFESFTDETQAVASFES